MLLGLIASLLVFRVFDKIKAKSQRFSYVLIIYFILDWIIIRVMSNQADVTKVVSSHFQDTIMGSTKIDFLDYNTHYFPGSISTMIWFMTIVPLIWFAIGLWVSNWRFDVKKFERRLESIKKLRTKQPSDLPWEN